jgi:small-conductance mechanosensitive channel
VVLVAVTAATLAGAQDETGDAERDRLQRLAEITGNLQSLKTQRAQLQQRITDTNPDNFVDEREELKTLAEDIRNLQATFEVVALHGIDTSVLQPVVKGPFNWQQELADIASPVFDSLRALTRRPRQMSNLREAIELAEQRIDVAERALATLQALPNQLTGEQTRDNLQQLHEDWQENLGRLQSTRLSLQTQLDNLLADDRTSTIAYWHNLKSFLGGRGLTIVLALINGLIAWAILKLLWWLYTTRMTNKHQRRRTTWFRLASYGYQLFIAIIVVLTAIVTIYVREDLLLLAFAALLLLGGALSFRSMLPNYVDEVRLLLGVGPLREDELVQYNGLPWQVMSLNIDTILRNPALDGVLRIPVELACQLQSRPVKDPRWFPSQTGDCIFLADGTFARVVSQTQESIELAIRGGMKHIIPTAQYYQMPITNLSAGEHFGIALIFGLDYSLQAKSLQQIPALLDQALREHLADKGLADDLTDLMVELSTANSSSLDYLIYATIDSARAADYYRYERALTQGCVAACNRYGWSIPYPQLSIHGLSTIE